MKQVLSVLAQVCRKGILVLGLVSLISLSSLFVFIAQPVYAAANAQAEKVIQVEEYSSPVETREEAYEQAAEIAKDPEKNLEKVYKKELKAFKQEQPDKGLVEEAQDLLDKVTGNS